VLETFRKLQKKKKHRKEFVRHIDHLTRIIAWCTVNKM